MDFLIANQKVRKTTGNVCVKTFTYTDCSCGFLSRPRPSRVSLGSLKAGNILKVLGIRQKKRSTTFKSINGLAPVYLRDIIQCVTHQTMTCVILSVSYFP